MQNQFVDLYRNGIRTAADVAKLSLENTVRMTEANSLEELLALQSRLAGAQMERVAEFWSSVWQVAAQTQKAWVGQMQSQIGQAKDSMRDTTALATRSAQEVARVAANQHERKSQEQQHRKSA